MTSRQSSRSQALAPTSASSSMVRGSFPQRQVGGRAKVTDVPGCIRDASCSSAEAHDAADVPARPRFRHNFSDIRVLADPSLPESELAAQASLHVASTDIENAPEVSNLDRQTHPPQEFPRSVTVVEHHRQPFSASIRRSNTRPLANEGYPGVGRRSAAKPGFAERYHDAMPGSEETGTPDFASVLAQTTAMPTGSIPEPRDAQTIQLPDIVFDQRIAETDAIASALTYAPTVSQSGPAPGPFGETLPYTFTMSAISVTPTPGTFNVSATVDNPITFQVSGNGHTDISSDTDSDITQANYPDVASDLTPDTSDLNGRPPRKKFWAEDLCIRHERFHATDGIGHARSGVSLAQTWLNGQTALSVADVNTLLGEVPARVIATRSAAMTHPGREERAYGDGAPLYLARANAIKTKGDTGGYGTGAAPSPGGGSTGLSRGAKVGIGLAGGALVGAGIGALAGGPIGAAIGAGVGAVVGLIGGLLL
jgi:hypothetical protein